jgi:hypothetical protein
LNERLIIAAAIAGWAALYPAAVAADDLCGSGSSAPVFDDNIQMNSPRQCGDEPPEGASEYKPSMPDTEPPVDSALPETGVPMESPEEPPPEPQQ